MSWFGRENTIKGVTLPGPPPPPKPRHRFSEGRGAFRVRAAPGAVAISGCPWEGSRSSGLHKSAGQQQRENSLGTGQVLGPFSVVRTVDALLLVACGHSLCLILTQPYIGLPREANCRCLNRFLSNADRDTYCVITAGDKVVKWVFRNCSFVHRSRHLNVGIVRGVTLRLKNEFVRI